jgi:4-alpha-glucanotransferase
VIRLKHSDRHRGVAVAISALKSENCLGCGEFNDLNLFGKWVKSCGFSLIQLLPVNDTGDDSSPYMALSSLALHPIYIHLPAVNGAAPFLKDIKALQQQFKDDHAVNYKAVLSVKMNMLQTIYDYGKKELLADKTVAAWLGENEWAADYAVFCHLKTKHNNDSWQNWRAMQTPSAEEIADYYKEHKEDCFFYVWIQYELDRQLSAAVAALQKNAVFLKGDLPIMMNEHSVDVWSRRNLFDLSFVAGAPPDQYSPVGQRWGFPCYRWEEHQKDNFTWWKARLRRAEKFFQAYRIDHVLGFFRIWSIDRYNSDAVLGFFNASIPITRRDLFEIGFTEERLHWFTEPHISEDEARAALGKEYDSVTADIFEKLSDENMLVFKKKIKGSGYFDALTISAAGKEHLCSFYNNRALVKDGDGYHASWFYQKSRAYQSCNNFERTNFDALVTAKASASEKIWEDHARGILKVMAESSGMLICAEDLGVITPAVPKVLNELNILSLRVVRWSREWSYTPARWVLINDYPFSSVGTLSVHDSSTLRVWWDEEYDKEGLMTALELPTSLAHNDFDIQTALTVISSFLRRCSSQLIILQIQDYFSLSEHYREEDKQAERINTPGTVNEKNWSYRIKPFIETLIEDKSYSLILNSIGKLQKAAG